MSKYANNFNPAATDQTEKIPGSTQVANSGGGFSWQVDDWTRLDRFLILGTEGGSYYASEKKMTYQAGETALRCLRLDGERVVRRIVEISEAGRAPKNDPAIFLLALAAKKGDLATRRAAFAALPQVCRTGYHLFQYLDTMKQFGGRGHAFRRSLGEWYTAKDLSALAYQCVKYRQRVGWTHRDALRLARPRAGDHDLLAWIVGKPFALTDMPKLVVGFEKLDKAETAKAAVKVLADYPDLPWECVPSTLLGHAEVWDALLPNLPMTALVRNLGRMTANGLIAPMSDAAKLVSERLNDAERIRKARVHPIALLGALCTYKLGHGVKGSLTWNPVREVLDALDAGFYLAFGNVEATGKRTILGLDVSGSMTSGTIAGMPGLTPRVASSAMAMVTARVESFYAIMAFSAQFVPVNIGPRERLDDVCQATARLPFESTDCAVPMTWALANKIKADTFVIYTDSETNHGRIHPAQALKQYRQKMGIDARLIVVGMEGNEFSIADPDDAGMLDVVGFDTATPNLIAQFATQ